MIFLSWLTEANTYTYTCTHTHCFVLTLVDKMHSLKPENQVLKLNVKNLDCSSQTHTLTHSQLKCSVIGKQRQSNNCSLLSLCYIVDPMYNLPDMRSLIKIISVKCLYLTLGFHVSGRVVQS